MLCLSIDCGSPHQITAISQIGGIGKVTESLLRDVIGIKTCEDLLQKGGYLCALFSQGSAGILLAHLDFYISWNYN